MQKIYIKDLKLRFNIVTVEITILSLVPSLATNLVIVLQTVTKNVKDSKTDTLLKLSKFL
jgi:hypothetical protein